MLAFLSLHRMQLRTHTLFHRKVRHETTLLLFLRAHKELFFTFLDGDFDAGRVCFKTRKGRVFFAPWKVCV
jgi:hypothetical protein